MKFIHRLGYYLGGFSIGLIVLAFFLSGKKTSCDYGPNARTIKNIASKKIEFSEESLLEMQSRNIDSLAFMDILLYGNVKFSESQIGDKPCNTYQVENIYKEKLVNLTI
ncbi:MAG: hypothetical protein R3213_08460 [Flavobacteriaceae bacterium]|nr:hypothetical protein [Flavobacteriaceae bacterium]